MKQNLRNSQDIAKEFNKFTSVGPRLLKKITSTEKIFQDFLTSHNE